MGEEELDLRGVPCPANTARAILRLALLDEGAILVVLLDDGEPIANVPPAVLEEGHEVLERTAAPGGGWRLRVRKGG